MQSNEAIARHDAAGIAAYLDSEYQITTGSGKHYQETPEEEAANWDRIFLYNEDVICVRNPDLIKLSSSTDLASENGSWVGTLSSTKGQVETGGLYFAKWPKLTEPNRFARRFS